MRRRGLEPPRAIRPTGRSTSPADVRLVRRSTADLSGPSGPEEALDGMVVVTAVVTRSVPLGRPRRRDQSDGALSPSRGSSRQSGLGMRGLLRAVARPPCGATGTGTELAVRLLQGESGT